MNLNEAIEARRSIRAYKADTTIEKSVVLDIIRTAQFAPSWKNSQTARYYVVMTSEKLAEVKKNCLPEFNQKNSGNAPVLIVTAFEKNHAGFNTEGIPDNELGNEWGAYDLGLQNMLLMLKAKEYGLDTLVMGIRNADALRAELSIPDSQEVVSVIALGYRDIEPAMPKRKDIDDITMIF